MNDFSRRDFLKQTALASASMLVPRFLQAFPGKYSLENSNGKILVVIQLAGGNDGLNAVVPWENDLYYKNRSTIALKKDKLIRANGELAFNNSLKGLADLFEEGHVSIINSVGYPDPNRSHFRSMDIWQSASNANQYLSTGWLGRTLDAKMESKPIKPYAAIEIDESLTLALKGEKIKGLAFNNLNTLMPAYHNPVISKVAKDFDNHKEEHDHQQVEYLHRTLVDTRLSTEYLMEKTKVYKSAQLYPQHAFSKKMKIVAELINSGSSTMIYYVSLPGFDTHVLQKLTQNNLLTIYAETLKAFCNELKAADRFKDVCILTFSEFGRRVAQNKGNGTDHGTANNVYIVSGAIKKPGVLNEAPDLANLDDGDLLHKVDFRSVYSTLLNNWLGIDSLKVMQGKFENLGFI